MGYRVRILSTAYSDMAEIIPVISRISNAWANRFADELEKHVNQLEFMPKMYPIYDDIPIFRKMNVDGFLVFYIVDDAKQSVEIHRIINGRMDIKSQI